MCAPIAIAALLCTGSFLTGVFVNPSPENHPFTTLANSTAAWIYSYISTPMMEMLSGNSCTAEIFRWVRELRKVFIQNSMDLKNLLRASIGIICIRIVPARSRHIMVDRIHGLGIIQDCHIQIKAAPPLRGLWVKAGMKWLMRSERGPEGQWEIFAAMLRLVTILGVCSIISSQQGNLRTHWYCLYVMMAPRGLPLEIS